MTADTGIGAARPAQGRPPLPHRPGHYTDDINRRAARPTPYFLRSPHAHAKIKSIDTGGRQAAPGVVAVFTGDDIAADKVGGLPCGWVVKDKHGQPHKAPAASARWRSTRCAMSATTSPW